MDGFKRSAARLAIPTHHRWSVEWQHSLDFFLSFGLRYADYIEMVCEVRLTEMREVEQRYTLSAARIRRR